MLQSIHDVLMWSHMLSSLWTESGNITILLVIKNIGDIISIERIILGPEANWFLEKLLG